ncbi:MAG: hypothetical protein AAFX94_09335 [Myxococcota bacterium]
MLRAITLSVLLASGCTSTAFRPGPTDLPAFVEYRRTHFKITVDGKSEDWGGYSSNFVELFPEGSQARKYARQASGFQTGSNILAILSGVGLGVSAFGIAQYDTADGRERVSQLGILTGVSLLLLGAASLLENQAEYRLLDSVNSHNVESLYSSQDARLGTQE